MATIEDQAAAQLASDYIDQGPQLPLADAAAPINPDEFTYEEPVYYAAPQDQGDPILDEAILEPEVEEPEVIEPEVIVPEDIATKAPETDQDFAKSALQKLINAQQGITVLNMAAGAKEAEVEQGFQDRRREIDEDNAIRMEEDRAQVDQAFTAYQEANDALGDQEIDPDRWWNSKSTGQKIAAGLSMMISGYLAASEGRAAGPSIIERAIDKDIKMQLADMKLAERGVQRSGNMLAHFKDRLGTTEKAVAALKVKAWDNALAQVRLSNLKQKSPMAKLKGQQAEAQITLQVNAARAKFAKASVMDEIKLNREKRDQKKGIREEEKHIRSTITNIKRGGVYLHANDSGARTKANELESNRVKAKDSVTKLTLLMSQYGPMDYVNPNAKIKTDMNAIVLSLRKTFREMLVGPGIISDTDREILNDAVKSGDGIWNTIITKRGRLQYESLLAQYLSDSETQMQFLVPTYTTKQKELGINKGAVKVNSKPKGGR